MHTSVTNATALFLGSVLFAACSTATMPSTPTAPVEVAAAPTPPAGVPVPPMPPPPPAPETARYRVTFEARWSPSTHPLEIPGSAHFSALVGGTHNASVSFWREGGQASRGIMDMAERGRTSPLDTEITTAISGGTADNVFTGGAIDKSPGTISLEFTATQRFPLVTLVSMVAPSPDWFVGVSGLALFENGRWVEERRVELDPWDAGTDSGVSFFSPDSVTVPAAPVSRIITAPLSPDGRVTPLGSFVFTRIN